MMDMVEALIKAALTAGAVAIIILSIAALFMVVFSLATSFDRRVNQ